MRKGNNNEKKIVSFLPKGYKRRIYTKKQNGLQDIGVSGSKKWERNRN